MPAGVAGSVSWVMMKRAALPSGDRKQFQTALEVGIVERFRWQVEVVATLWRRRRPRPIALAVSVIREIWSTRPEKLLCIVSRLPCIDFATAMIGGNCASICGSIASILPMSFNSAFMLSLNLSTPSRASNTDLVRPADRNVEAVWFPIEIITNRPRDIVEIRQMVPDFVQRGLHFVHVAEHVMSRVAHLAHQVVHPLHRADHRTEVVAHFEHVGRPILHELKVFLYRNRLSTDLERYRRVLDRAAQWPGDALHHRDSRRTKDFFGKPVQNDHVAGVPHIVITFDHEDIGIHRGSAEMALGGRISDIRWQVGGM